jgi:hypothetical protein
MRAETQVGLHEKCPLFLSDFNQKCDFSSDFSITSQYPSYENPFSCSEIVSCGQADGQTDMLEIIGAFFQLCLQPRQIKQMHLTQTATS